MHFSVRQARLYAGYTQAEMADFLRISRKTYAKLEKNQDLATVSQLRLTAALTGVPLEAFFEHSNSTIVEKVRKKEREQ